MSSGAVHREPSGAGQGAASTQQYYAHALDPAHNCTQKEVSRGLSGRKLLLMHVKDFYSEI